MLKREYQFHKSYKGYVYQLGEMVGSNPANNGEVRTGIIVWTTRDGANVEDLTFELRGERVEEEAMEAEVRRRIDALVP